MVKIKKKLGSPKSPEDISFDNVFLIMDPSVLWQVCECIHTCTSSSHKVNINLTQPFILL